MTTANDRGFADMMRGLRMSLAEARIALRSANDDMAVTKALAESRVIEEVGGEKALGANAEARERALTLALAQSASYQAGLQRLREMEARVERLQAEVDAVRDARRESEWRVRERLAQVLEMGSLEITGAEPTERAAFDAVVDNAIVDRVTEQAAASLIA